MGHLFDSAMSRGQFHAHIGKPEHHNGTVGTSKAEVTPTASDAKIMSLLIQNTHASNTLQVSFDVSTNWFTIAAGKSLGIGADITSFWVVGSGSGTTYESLMILEP
jgi:hypothetical protein